MTNSLVSVFNKVDAALNVIPGHKRLRAVTDLTNALFVRAQELLPDEIFTEDHFREVIQKRNSLMESESIVDQGKVDYEITVRNDAEEIIAEMVDEMQAVLADENEVETPQRSGFLGLFRR